MARDNFVDFVSAAIRAENVEQERQCCRGHVGLRKVDRVRVHRRVQVQAPPGSGSYFWEFVLVGLQDRPNQAEISVVDP